MGSGMRALKIAAVVMGVLILVGTAVIIGTIVRRTMTGSAGPGLTGAPARAFAVLLDEPAGTGIVGIASVRDRLAVRLRGGGLDRVVLIDPASGAVVGRISLAR